MYDDLQPEKRIIDINIWKSIITKVSRVKFLGVAIDENLTYKDHVNKVRSKISKSVGCHEDTPLPVASKRNI